MENEYSHIKKLGYYERMIQLYEGGVIKLNPGRSDRFDRRNDRIRRQGLGL